MNEHKRSQKQVEILNKISSMDFSFSSVSAVKNQAAENFTQEGIVIQMENLLQLLLRETIIELIFRLFELNKEIGVSMNTRDVKFDYHFSMVRKKLKCHVGISRYQMPVERCQLY